VIVRILIRAMRQTWIWTDFGRRALLSLEGGSGGLERTSKGETPSLIGRPRVSCNVMRRLGGHSKHIASGLCRFVPDWFIYSINHKTRSVCIMKKSPLSRQIPSNHIIWADIRRASQWIC